MVCKQGGFGRLLARLREPILLEAGELFTQHPPGIVGVSSWRSSRYDFTQTGVVKTEKVYQMGERELDVRGLPKRDKHPAIFATYEQLPVGGVRTGKQPGSQTSRPTPARISKFWFMCWLAAVNSRPNAAVSTCNPVRWCGCHADRSAGLPPARRTLGAARFAVNVLTHPDARRRAGDMRRNAFRRCVHLAAVARIAEKPDQPMTG